MPPPNSLRPVITSLRNQARGIFTGSNSKPLGLGTADEIRANVLRSTKATADALEGENEAHKDGNAADVWAYVGANRAGRNAGIEELMERFGRENAEARGN